MYCPPQYPTNSYSYGQCPQVSIMGYPGLLSNSTASQLYNGCYSNPYSPTGERPSPSFRIDDILVNERNSIVALGSGNHGHYTNMALMRPSFHTSSPYCVQSSYPAPNLPPEAGNLSHSMDETNASSQAYLNSLPVYFRLRPNTRPTNGRKCRKPRTVFSDMQLMVLEREFLEHRYLSTPQRSKLAERLRLDPIQVKTWFQNRRMKLKKENVGSKDDKESDDEHASK